MSNSQISDRFKTYLKAVGLLLILLLSFIGLREYLAYKIQEELSSACIKLEEQNIRAGFLESHVSLLHSTLILDSLSIEGYTGEDSFDISIPKLTISNIHYWALITKKKLVAHLDVTGALIDIPNLDALVQLKIDNDGQPFLCLFEEVSIKDSRVLQLGITKKDKLTNVSAEIKNLHWKNEQGTVALLSEFKKLFIHSLKVWGDKKDLTFEIGHLSKDNKTLTASHCSIKHDHSIQEHANIFIYRKGHYDFLIDSISILFERNSLDTMGIELLNIRDPQFQIYQDISKPKRPGRVKKIVQEIIDDISYPFYIDTIRLTNGQVDFAIENANCRHNPTSIAWDNVYASGYSFNNIGVNDQAHLDIIGKTYGEIATRLSYDFNLADPKYPYTISGGLDAFSFEKFNDLTLSLKNISCEQGMVSQFKFNINANALGLSGELDMRYENAECNLHKDDVERKWLSWMANLIAIHDANPNLWGMRMGKCSYTRDVSDTFFYQLWQCLRSGIEDIMIRDI